MPSKNNSPTLPLALADDGRRSTSTATGTLQVSPLMPHFTPSSLGSGSDWDSGGSGWTEVPLDVSEEDDSFDRSDRHGFPDHDAPWMPTMSLLMKTGQLDAIESDSDEDREDSSGGGSIDAADVGENDATGGEDLGSSAFHLGVDEDFTQQQGDRDAKRKDDVQSSPSSKQSVPRGRAPRLVPGGTSLMSTPRGTSPMPLASDRTDVLGNHYPNLDGSDSASNFDALSSSYGGNTLMSSHSDLLTSQGDTLTPKGKADSGDEAQRQKESDARSTTSSRGYDVDDFMGGGEAPRSDFFDQVANSYLTTVKNIELLCDNNSGAEGSSLSDSLTYENAKKISAERSAGGEDHRSSTEKRTSLSIRSLGESIVRRGRSRGREKKERRSLSRKAKAKGQGGMATTNGTLNDDAAEAQGRTRSRSRSIFGRLKGSTKRHNSQSPKRSSSMKIDGSRHAANASPGRKRDATSLPRKISHTAGTTRDSLLDYSLGDFGGSTRSSLEISDLALPRKRKPKIKKCLICHQKIPRGESIQHMDHFIWSKCYSCVTCSRRLSPEEDAERLQIISDLRGTTLRCGECAAFPVIPEESSSAPPQEPDGESVSEKSIHMDDEDDEDRGPPRRYSYLSNNTRVTGASGGDHLMIAAKSLAEKASVKLSIGGGSDGSNDDSGGAGEDRVLCTLFFMQDEDSLPAKRSAESSARIVYELDSDAFGNPNYDGYACSINNFASEDMGHGDTQRIKTVALPRLSSDEIDGAISKELQVDLEWTDEDGDYSCRSFGTGVGSIPLERSGPAMLSIEQFKSNLIQKETVMKVLRQSWEYEEESLFYKLTFVVPFKKMYISWEIAEGDELDLAQCQLEVTIQYNPRKKEVEDPELEEMSIQEQEETSTPDTIADTTPEEKKEESSIMNAVNESDDMTPDNSMPDAVFLQANDRQSVVSISPGSASLPGPTSSSIVQSRKNGGIDPDRDENDNFSELLSVASCVNSIMQLPTIAYVHIEKKDLECEVGLSLIEKNGATVVAEVSKSGLFVDSKIVEGCEILAINGQCVRGPRSVIRMLKDLTGMVTVAASDGPSPPGARFVVKKCRSTGLGKQNGPASQDIVFQNMDGLVSVVEIAEDGLFAGSPISKGDICLSIDGVPALNAEVARRSLARSQNIVAMLIFSLSGFWKNVVEFIIDEKFNRWWKKNSECTLLSEDCTPITLMFDERTSLCKTQGSKENEVDLRYMNIIIERVMNLLKGSMMAYRKEPREKVRSKSRSLSVSASCEMKNRSDVYRRALIKLDEMRENGKLSAKDYEAGRLALAQVAIQTAT